MMAMLAVIVQKICTNQKISHKRSAYNVEWYFCSVFALLLFCCFLSVFALVLLCFCSVVYSMFLLCFCSVFALILLCCLLYVFALLLLCFCSVFSVEVPKFGAMQRNTAKLFCWAEILEPESTAQVGWDIFFQNHGAYCDSGRRKRCICWGWH